jgi:hypothetical protein
VADIVVDGTTRVAYVVTIANINAPATATELNAGSSLLLQTILTADGLMNFQADTADVDNSSMASKFDTVVAGRASFKNSALKLKKQLTGDTTFTTLTVQGTTGFIVVRRYIDQATAWAAGQLVEVYPIMTGFYQPQDPASNEVAKYVIPVKITSTPSLTATTAA